jgi:peptidoglycan/LPS O-acetylase OafA/YrhL
MQQLSPASAEAGRPNGNPTPTGHSDRRIKTLDGLRGLATIMVIVSHYFAELPHGLRFLECAWIAVNLFFVLSGFLIGKLILERQHHANFFAVFYLRRFCRIIPAYMLTILVLTLLIRELPAAWTDADQQFPLWSYLTFLQGFFMVQAHSIGAHWLAPTWTLGVEEHFYLLIPATIVFTPRQWLAPVLVVLGVASVALRAQIFLGGGNEFIALALLPGLADVLVCGLLAAIAMKSEGVPWPRLLPALRVTPLVALLAVFAVHVSDPKWFGVLSPLLLGIGGTAYLLCIVHGTPEANSFNSKVLQWFGNNGYCLYLTHLPVLGLMHGLILGSKPDLATPAQWLVTVAALPVCVLVGWGMTRLIEEPLTRYGRTWRWSPQMRATRQPYRASLRGA